MKCRRLLFPFACLTFLLHSRWSNAQSLPSHAEHPHKSRMVSQLPPKEIFAPGVQSKTTFETRLNSLKNRTEKYESLLFQHLSSPNPWYCNEETGISYNLHSLMAEKIRNELQSENSKKFRESYLSPIEPEARPAFQHAVESGILTEMAEVAYKYRFTPEGEAAIERLVDGLRKKGEDSLASLFVKGWLKDYPTLKNSWEINESPHHDRCDERKTRIAFKALHLFHWLADEAAFKQVETALKACDQTTGNSLTPVLRLIKHSPTLEDTDEPKSLFSLWSEINTVPLSDQPINEPEQPALQATQALFKIAIAYSDERQDFFHGTPDARNFTLCEHLEPRVTMNNNSIFKDSASDDDPYRLSHFFFLYPSIAITHLENLLKEEEKKDRKQLLYKHFARLEKRYPTLAGPLLVNVLLKDIYSNDYAVGLLANINTKSVQHAVSKLIDDLNGSEESLSGSAAEILGRLGSKASSAAPHLKKKLENATGNHEQFLTSFFLVSPSSEAIKALSETDKVQQIAAATALCETKEDISQALPALITALEKGSNAVREQISCALAHLGKNASPAEDIILTTLKDKTPHPKLEATRQSLLQALKSIGPKSPAAISVLEEMLLDDEAASATQIEAAEALGVIGEKAIPSLTKGLRNPHTAPAIPQILASMKGTTKNIAPLIDALEIDNPLLQHEIEKVFTTPSKKAILKKVLSDPLKSSTIKNKVQKTLRNIESSQRMRLFIQESVKKGEELRQSNRGDEIERLEPHMKDFRKILEELRQIE